MYIMVVKEKGKRKTRKENAKSIRADKVQGGTAFEADKRRRGKDRKVKAKRRRADMVQGVPRSRPTKPRRGNGRNGKAKRRAMYRGYRVRGGTQIRRGKGWKG